MSEKQVEPVSTKAEPTVEKTVDSKATVSTPKFVAGLTEEQRNYLKGASSEMVGFLAGKTSWRMHKGRPQFFCQYCKKWVLAEKSIEDEAGAYCLHVRQELGYTDASLKQLHASKVASKPEDLSGKVKTAQLHKMCSLLDIPIARLVKAFGGDRQLNGPNDPHFKYVHGPRNARYVDEWCASLPGMQYLAGPKRGVRWADAKAACATVCGKDVAEKLYGKTAPAKEVKPQVQPKPEDGKAQPKPEPVATVA